MHFIKIIMKGNPNNPDIPKTLGRINVRAICGIMVAADGNGSEILTTEGTVTTDESPESLETRLTQFGAVFV